MKLSIKCCEHFEKNVELFDWYSYYDEKQEVDVHLLPCIKNSRVRINHCPTCGKKVRDIRMIIENN